MHLTEVQNSYFENQASQRKYKIDITFQKENERIISVDESVQHLVYLQRVKDYAKDTIDSRVNAYIETFKKYEKYPDEEDMETFRNESEPYVLNKSKLFPEYCNRFNGPNVPPSVVDAITHTLTFDLRSIFREALFPLDTFYLEGKVHEEDKVALKDAPNQQKPDVSWSRSDILTLAGIIVAAVSAVIGFIITLILSSDFRKFIGLEK